MVFAFSLYQNDVSDIPDLTFSMDPDEEKHILYEKTEVLFPPFLNLSTDLWPIPSFFFFSFSGKMYSFYLLLLEEIVDHPC